MFGFMRTPFALFPTGAFDPPSARRHLNGLLQQLALALLVLAVLLAMLAPRQAHAENTIFLTDRNGQLSFPISPPNRATSAPGAIDNMAIGVTTPSIGRFTQMQPGGNAPAIASGACGTGTNGAIVAGSTSASGQLTIGAAATTTCTATFTPALTVAPKSCTFFPMNAAAAATGTTIAYGSAPTTAGFVLNGAALANANYAYQCF
jgi:hypothetical protein